MGQVWYQAAVAIIKKLFSKEYKQVKRQVIAREVVIFVSWIKNRIFQDIQSRAHTQNFFCNMVTSFWFNTFHLYPVVFGIHKGNRKERNKDDFLKQYRFIEFTIRFFESRRNLQNSKGNKVMRTEVPPRGSKKKIIKRIK